MISKTTDKQADLRTGKRAPVAAFFYLVLAVSCVVFADLLPLSFSPQQVDLAHTNLPPILWQSSLQEASSHWLGTDRIGRDVLANIVYGSRTAFLVSIPAITIATLVGLLLGGIAGYYGNQAVRVKIASICFLTTTGILAYYYSFYIRQPFQADMSGNKFIAASAINWFLFSGIIAAGIMLNKWIAKYFSFAGHVYLPIDQIILRFIELISSIPRIIIILCLAAYTRPSLLNLILITGFTYWTEPARLIRAELLRIKTLNYIESAKAMGMADFYILIRHALPNALSSIIVAATFGMAGLIALESTLSFLNIGIPADIASWGKMVASARNNFSAWWLVLFPGLALCGTVLSIQTVSNWLVQRLDPKNR